MYSSNSSCNIFFFMFCTPVPSYTTAPGLGRASPGWLELSAGIRRPTENHGPGPPLPRTHIGRANLCPASHLLWRGKEPPLVFFQAQDFFSSILLISKKGRAARSFTWSQCSPRKTLVIEISARCRPKKLADSWRARRNTLSALLMLTRTAPFAPLRLNATPAGGRRDFVARRPLLRRLSG